METLTLEHTYFIAEIMGVIALIISLIYVAHQIKQNTQMMRVGTTQADAVQANYLLGQLVQDSELTRIWALGREDYDTLDELEKLRLRLISFQLLSFFHGEYVQWQQGVMHDAIWYKTKRTVEGFMQWPCMIQAWDLSKNSYPEDYQHFIKNRVQKGTH